jgi:NADP-dependent 3-hydroxy acid dehydrogenase YdfG
MKIALAYNEEDSQLIKKLETDLSQSGYSFVHFDFSKSKPEYLLYEALADYQWPILLFVSKAFLKSATSMTGMLRFFQKKEDQIYPILIPAEAGDMSSVPDIERVGGIIKYINYWQEHYLDLRKQKRELHLADEESFNAHLKRIREISTEVGEFLRQLRASTYCNLAEFEAEDYEIFFEFMDDATAWEQFKKNRKTSAPAEAGSLTDVYETEEKMVQEVIDDIPGISMLPKEEPEAAATTEPSGSIESPSEEVQQEDPISEKEETVEIMEDKEESIPEIVLTEEPAEETIQETPNKKAGKAPKSKKENKEMKLQQEYSDVSDADAATQNALDALRSNINRLTEILKEKEAAAQKAAEDRPGIGKTVFITGGTSGIGKATARIFAENGYNVIITGRREERVKAIGKEFSEAYDTKVSGLVFDVRNFKAVEKALKGMGEDLKKIDVLINNAGKAKGFDPIHEGNFEHWEEMIDTNIKGLLYLTRLVAPHMVAKKKGHIINIGSIAGKEAYPNGNVYCATKFAVDGLTKAMRIDLHAHNVRVSQIAPAHVEATEFALVRFDGDEEKAKIYEDFTPVNSTDIAETLYFMASRPEHVNILDVVIQGTQQPSAMIIDRSGRK